MIAIFTIREAFNRRKEKLTESSGQIMASIDESEDESTIMFELPADNPRKKANLLSLLFFR